MSLKKIFQPVNLFFFLCCVYSLQGVIYATGSMVAKIILMVILVWSMCLWYKVNVRNKLLPKFLYALNAFLMLTTIYGAILIISGKQLYIVESGTQVSNLDYLKNIFWSLLPIYVFYEYARQGKLRESHMRVYSLCLLFLAIVSYLNTAIQTSDLSNFDLTSQEFTANVGYSFLAILPLLFFWHKRTIWQFFFLLICFFFIIISMKRGAILIGSICFAYFLWITYRNAKGRVKVFIVLLSIVSIFVAVVIINYLILNNDYFIYRIESTLEGDSSHRDEIYMTYFTHFISETNFFKFAFGNGADATLAIGPNYAHNDWLELAINNGCLGLMIYVWYFIALLKDSNTVRRKNQLYSKVILMVFIIMFSSTLFSMSYASMSKALSLAIGFTLAQIYNKNQIGVQSKITLDVEYGGSNAN